MSLKIKNHLFTGPFDIESASVRANQDPAVYAVVAKGGEPWNPVFKVLETGDTGEAGLKFTEHPHKASWTETAAGKPGVYLLHFSRKEVSASERAAVLDTIRAALDTTGGVIPMGGL